MKGTFLIAFSVHAAAILFGGLVVNAVRQKQVERIRDVDLVEEVRNDEKPRAEEREVKKVAKVEETKPEQMPDTTVLDQLDQTPAPPGLDAVSLSDLESALGGGGGGDFGKGFGFGSGGVIGGSGSENGAGGLGDAFGEGGFDQKPRVVSSVAPDLPPAIRKRGGSITVLLNVNEQGRVIKATVEKSTDPALEAPALAALRRWVFEPGVRGGRKAAFKTRQTVRFDSASG